MRKRKMIRHMRIALCVGALCCAGALCGQVVTSPINPMTTLGDMIYGQAAGVPGRVPGNTTAFLRVLTQTGDGVNSALPVWQVPPSAGTLNYYFTPTASSIATYLQMVAVPFNPKTTLTFAGLPIGPADVIQNWATNAGIPNLTVIQAGVYEMHVHALKSAGGNAAIFCEFWEVNSAGVDIALIGTSESTPLLSGVETEYTLAFVDGNTYTLTSSSSRIVARVRATVTGFATSVQIFVGGTADSHISLPSATIDATNFVPYLGATKDVALGAHGITGAPFTGDSGAGGTTGLVPAPAAGDAAAGKLLSADGTWKSNVLLTINSSTGPNNTNVETSLLGAAVKGSKTLPANLWDNGVPIRIQVAGTWAVAAAANTLTLKLKCGATVLAQGATDFSSQPGAPFATTISWSLNGVLMGIGTGAGGSINAAGLGAISTVFVTPTFPFTLAIVLDQNTPVAYDFTQTCPLDLTAQWTTAFVGTHIEGTQALIERVLQ